MLTDQIIIHQTQAWLRKVVIGCNFCPFAGRELQRGSIHYEVVTGSVASILEVLLRECRRLDANAQIETTLLILPEGFADFLDYLDLITLVDGLLVEYEYEGIYQIASFHPDYRFAEAEVDDPANYTNRSLYPMLHLLREESIERALENFPNAEDIPQRNIDFARQRGLAHMQLLREACFSENF